MPYQDMLECASPDLNPALLVTKASCAATSGWPSGLTNFANTSARLTVMGEPLRNRSRTAGVRHSTIVLECDTQVWSWQAIVPTCICVHSRETSRLAATASSPRLLRATHKCRTALSSWAFSMGPRKTTTPTSSTWSAWRAAIRRLPSRMTRRSTPPAVVCQITGGTRRPNSAIDFIRPDRSPSSRRKGRRSWALKSMSERRMRAIGSRSIAATPWLSGRAAWCRWSARSRKSGAWRNRGSITW